jgi:hypothetical protein
MTPDGSCSVVHLLQLAQRACMPNLNFLAWKIEFGTFLGVNDSEESSSVVHMLQLAQGSCMPNLNFLAWKIELGTFLVVNDPWQVMFSDPSASAGTRSMYDKVELSSLKNRVGHFFGGQWPLTGHVQWSIWIPYHKEPVSHIWRV